MTDLEELVLPGVEQDPRAHYIDYTRATDWEETVASLEDRLREWFADGAADGAPRDDPRECDVDGAIDGAPPLRLMLFASAPSAPAGGAAGAGAPRAAVPRAPPDGAAPDGATIRATVGAQFGVADFVLLSGTTAHVRAARARAADDAAAAGGAEPPERRDGADAASAETSAAEEEEASVALLSALTVACAAARRPAPHYSARLAAFVMMDGCFRPITGYHLARAAGSAVR